MLDSARLSYIVLDSARRGAKKEGGKEGARKIFEKKKKGLRFPPRSQKCQKKLGNIYNFGAIAINSLAPNDVLIRHFGLSPGEPMTY